MSRWGLDVTEPSGNLLIRHGFTARKHAGLGGSSVYTRIWRDRRIELHSQWVGIGGGGRPGMVFLRPLGCIRILPSEVSEAPLGLHSSELPSRAAGDPKAPNAEPALSEFLAWLDAYESWATGLRSPQCIRPAGDPATPFVSGLQSGTSVTNNNSAPSSTSR